MRAFIAALLLVTVALPVLAGEIVVYNQKWTGKTLAGTKGSIRGGGYILLDMENQMITQICTAKLAYSKSYRVEKYQAPVFAWPGSSLTGGPFLAVHGSLKSTQSLEKWEKTVFLKGKLALLSIGPSQKKQAPKILTGLRRMTDANSLSHRISEDSFSATFDAKITNDANANSRTLDEQVELLTKSLTEAGYSNWGL